MASYDEWRLVETEFIDGPCSGLLTMTFVSFLAVLYTGIE